MRKKIAIITFSVLLISQFAIAKAKNTKKSVIINEVIATVENIPITSLDLYLAKNDQSLLRYKKKKNIDLKSRALDLLINRTIIDLTASNESIMVSKERIANSIKKEMSMRKISDIKKFKKIVKKNYKMTWKEYKVNLSRQIKTQQLMQIKVTSKQSTEKELKKWYQKNKKKLGKKYTYRVIRVRFNIKSTKSELRANKRINTALKIARTNFANAAIRYSDHPSRKNGGLITDQRIDELIKDDRLLAGIVNNSKPGKMTPVVRSPKGRFYIVKMIKVYDIRYKDVENQIKRIIASQNGQKAFAEWLEAERRKLGVKVFLPGYKEE